MFGLSLISNKTKLMDAVDRIKDRMGQETIHLASEGIRKSLAMKRLNKIRNSTTDWNELIIAQ